MIDEVIELRNAPIAIPDNIRVGTEILPAKEEIPNTRNNAINDPKNAKHHWFTIFASQKMCHFLGKKLAHLVGAMICQSIDG